MFSISASCRSKLGTLSNDHHDEDNNSVKEQLFLCAKQLLCTCNTLFSTFLWRPLHDYDVKPPYATFHGGRGNMTTNLIFLSLYLNMDKALKNLTPGKVAYICRIERFQIDAIKIERTQIHFFVMFSLPSSSSMRKVPITMRTTASRKKLKVVSLGPIKRQVIVNAAKKHMK